MLYSYCVVHTLSIINVMCVSCVMPCVKCVNVGSVNCESCGVLVSVGLGVCSNKPWGVNWAMMFISANICLCVCLPRYIALRMISTTTLVIGH